MGDGGGGTAVLSNMSSGPNSISACFYSGCDSALWMLDSGCTDHISPHQSDFSSLAPNATVISLGDSSSITATGKGSITAVTLVNGTTSNILLQHVLHVPKAKYRFLSISKLVEKGFDVLYSGNTCVISK